VGSEGKVLALALAPDGKVAASGHEDGAVRLWDAATGKELRRLGGKSPAVASLAWLPDGRSLLLRNRAGHAVLWDRQTGRALRPILYPRSGGDGPVAVAPDGRTAALGGWQLYMVDLRTGKPLSRPLEGYSRDPDPDGFFPAFSPDGKFLTAAIRGDSTLALSTWDAGTGKLLHRFPWLDKPDDLRRPTSLVYTPDGRSVAMGLRDGTVRLWEAATGGQQVVYGTHPRSVTALAVSPDGRYLASAGVERIIRVRDLVSGWSVAHMRGHEGRITALAFAPDGCIWSASEDANIVVWHGPQRPEPERPTEVTGSELESMWRALAGRNAAAAYDASRRLLTSPDAAITFLRGRLRPVPPIEPGRPERLVADLGAARFATRQRAERELERLGRLAESALRKALTDPGSEERRRRVAGLLARVAPERMSANELLQWRALEVAEYAGTPESRRFLEDLARGAPGPLLTRWANEALQRLKRHGPPR
jgi:hypothetical protein